jgi:predicted Zn-dependent protease
MNRRKFVQIIGGALTIPSVGSTASCSSDLTADALSINLFQTERFRDKQQERYNNSTEVQAEIVPIMEDALSELINESVEIDITVVERPVSISENELERNEIPARFAHNLLWTYTGMSDSTIETAAHSNLLLDLAESRTNYSFGIGWFGMIPSCVSSAERFSSVYIGRKVIEDREQFPEMARVCLHEIGHNLGLKHKHGCVIKDSDGRHKSVMFSDSYMRENDNNMFGQQLMLLATSRNKFNPKLSSEYLTW